MTFRVIKVSDYEFEEFVNIETIEELKKVYDKYGKIDLIIDFCGQFVGEDGVPVIMIYDDYIE